jgi:hypothetical protein
MTPEQELQRAREAESLLNSPLFVEARQSLERQLAALRRDVNIHSTEMHTRLILMEQLSGRFFSFFEQALQTGKMAQVKLQDEERRRTLQERAVDMFRRQGRNAL